MKELTENEKGYLQIAYDNGYRWIATDNDDDTSFYSEKPTKLGNFWRPNCFSMETESIIGFGTSRYDEEPTSIADLLGIDDVDWSKVKPFTPVWVRDDDSSKWYPANWIELDENCPFGKYCVTDSNQWTYEYGECSSYEQCRLATEEEIKERTAVLIK